METITENDEDDNIPEEDEGIEFSAKQTKPEAQTLLTPPPLLQPPKTATIISNTKNSFPELYSTTVKKNSSVSTLSNLLQNPKRTASVPRNTSTVSLGQAAAVRRRKESVISMSSMDFTGSSIQLHLSEPVSISRGS